MEVKTGTGKKIVIPDWLQQTFPAAGVYLPEGRLPIPALFQYPITPCLRAP
jgi:hypothetical protein